jgi:signal transduction histidine kinase
MASAPAEPRAVAGRLDGEGRLIAADPELQALQREAGSDLGQALALPQVAAIAQLARKLGIRVARPAIAASADNDIELWVNAWPEGDEIALSLEGWIVRPAASARLTSILGGGSETHAADSRNEWSTDEQLRIISLSAELAELLGIETGEAAGAPLTRLVRLEESAEGEMPLIQALAARQSFTGQRARSRADDSRVLLLSGEVVASADGSFAGFRGSVDTERDAAAADAKRATHLDQPFDELLRSPVDRIIDSAEGITARKDGPLRSDYASYGNDIASAARHLLSVLRGMTEDSAQAHGVVDLAALAAEAVIMLESSAEERGLAIELDGPESLRARGEERGIIQILVNLMVNAIRYSPENGAIRLTFGRTAGTASITVSDQGPGIAGDDAQRIFERFERAHSGDGDGGAGLGLAISRRLARAMGGDVTLDSAPGDGARFTLTLPAA